MRWKKLAGASALALMAAHTSMAATTSENGPLSGIGDMLADEGIYLRFGINNEAAGNITGGAAQGYTNVGQVHVGTDIDLQKLIGWKGGSIHITVYRDYGNGLASEVTGTYFKQQEVYKNVYTKLHVGLITFEQKMFDDKLDVTVGQMGGNAFFGHLSPDCYFQTGAVCGLAVVVNSEAGLSQLPSGTWGGNVRYHITKHYYVNTGAFEVDPALASTNGLDFSTHDATGVTVPIEFGYENTSFKQTQFPTALKIGYYSSTGSRSEPYYNAKGQSAGLTGTKLGTASGLRQGAYIVGERVVWRPDLSSNRSLDLFGGYAQPFDEQEVIDRQIFAGFLLRQPFISRPLDSVGFVVNYLHLSPGEVDYLRDVRTRLGGHGTNSPNEFAFEVNYGIGLTRNIRFTPNMQFVINPDNSAAPNITFVPRDMVVFGAKLTIDFAGLAGLPDYPNGSSDD